MIEYLSEIETEFENTLGCLSGAQMGSNQEKIGVENLVTHSLKSRLRDDFLVVLCMELEPSFLRRLRQDFLGKDQKKTLFLVFIMISVHLIKINMIKN